jgi:hypothetical protein
MVKENSCEEVEGVTKKGLADLPDLSAAMTHLTKLKAVGPATASGMLKNYAIFTNLVDYANLIYPSVFNYSDLHCNNNLPLQR